MISTEHILKELHWVEVHSEILMLKIESSEINMDFNQTEILVSYMEI
jgi:hypothetical protein